jgi:predicted alpha/beta hydrolase
MSESSVAVLHGFYVNARRDLRRVAPDGPGAMRIGHFGFFREDRGGRLWPAMLDWINAATGR